MFYNNFIVFLLFIGYLQNIIVCVINWKKKTSLSCLRVSVTRTSLFIINQLYILGFSESYKACWNSRNVHNNALVTDKFKISTLWIQK